MVLALILLAVLAVVLFGAGFALHVLWWAAIAALVLLVISFVVHWASGRGRTPV